MSYSMEIQNKARDLLTGGQVDCVIGYELGPRGLTRPAFIHAPEQAARLVWNQTCTHNLTTYLGEKLASKAAENNDASMKRVAVVVKACDSRTINVLLAEKRFQREQVHLIGVVCDGILEDAGKLDCPPAGETGHYQARCQHCKERTPLVYDTLIGEPTNPPQGYSSDSRLTELDNLQSLTAAQRSEFWLSQFDRCIRCYACRQACPICDCPTCLYERDDSLWVGMGIGLNEKRTFHLGRAFHLAGRCIGCDECERVCPMNIPISLLNRRLAQEIETAFGYRAGMAPVPAPFVTVLDER
ncbi:MAG: 4Fe-4S dicluster domain-containing protein [Anaerolineales bacterium]|jgi:formate dehydrogenase subunit beta